MGGQGLGLKDLPLIKVLDSKPHTCYQLFWDRFLQSFASALSGLSPYVGGWSSRRLDEILVSWFRLLSYQIKKESDESISIMTVNSITMAIFKTEQKWSTQDELY